MVDEPVGAAHLRPVSDSTSAVPPPPAGSHCHPQRQMHIGDFGKDLDDEVAALVTAQLIRAGQISLAGVVANLDPPTMRARLAKGT